MFDCTGRSEKIGERSSFRLLEPAGQRQVCTDELLQALTSAGFIGIDLRTKKKRNRSRASPVKESERPTYTFRTTHGLPFTKVHRLSLPIGRAKRTVRMRGVGLGVFGLGEMGFDPAIV